MITVLCCTHKVVTLYKHVYRYYYYLLFLWTLSVFHRIFYAAFELVCYKICNESPLKSFLSDEKEAVESKSSGGNKTEINDNFISSEKGVDTHAIQSSKKIDFWYD